MYILDSEIALHWIASRTKQLKPWVRNRVIEISRFTDFSQLFHVESSMNPSDVCTKLGATLKDVNDESKFHNGKPWMKKPLNESVGTIIKM